MLERLALPAGACVAFEDSALGLASALAAGVPAVVTPSVYTDDQDFPGALAVLSDLGDPQAPYRHVAGAGASDCMVGLDALARWLAGPGWTRAGGNTCPGTSQDQFRRHM